MTSLAALINGAVFTTTVSALCLGGALLLRSFPRARNLLCTFALAAVMLWPAFVAVANAAHWGIFAEPGEQDRWSKESQLTATAQDSNGPSQKQLDGAPFQVQSDSLQQSFGLSDGLLLLWTLGSAISVAMLLMEAHRGRRIAHEVAEEGASSEDLETADALRRHGLSFTVLRTDFVTAPAALPYRGGIILLPLDDSGLSAEEREAAVLHEAEHLAGRHSTLFWIYGLAVASAWWHPLTRILRNAAEDALEDLCDDRTIALQRTGMHLAKCLLAYASGTANSLPGAFHMFRSGTAVARRVRRLLERGDHTMKYNRIAAAGAALLSLGSLAVAGSLTLSPKSLTEATFGLSKGSVWTYRVTFADGRTMPLTKEAVGTRKVHGLEVTELKVTRPSLLSYEYLSNNERALLQFQNAYKQNFPGIQESYAPIPLLKKNVKAGDSWSWSEIPPVQIGSSGSGSKPIDMEKFRITTTAHVVSMSATTQTDAGEFDAVVVRYEVVSRDGNREYTVWYSPTAGIIKQEDPQAFMRKIELVEFRPAEE